MAAMHVTVGSSIYNSKSLKLDGCTLRGNRALSGGPGTRIDILSRAIVSRELCSTNIFTFNNYTLHMCAEEPDSSSVPLRDMLIAISEARSSNCTSGTLCNQLSHGIANIWPTLEEVDPEGVCSGMLIM